AAQLAHQLHVVIAGDTQRASVRDHVAHEPHGIKDARPAIDQVADEDGFPSQRVLVAGAAAQGRFTRSNRAELVTKSPEELFQLITTAVNIADDINGTMFVTFIAVQPHTLDGGGFHFLRRFQYENVAKAFFAETTQRAAQLRTLLANDVSAKVAFVT